MSGSDIYEIRVGIKPMPRARWETVARACAGKIELLTGRSEHPDRATNRLKDHEERRTAQAALRRETHRPDRARLGPESDLSTGPPRAESEGS